MIYYIVIIKLFTMKYYRFSRRRKDYFRCFRSKKKSDYMILTGRSKILDSGSFDNLVWGALIKAWKRYKIAKNKDSNLQHIQSLNS
jgi:hypothetical protein